MTISSTRPREGGADSELSEAKLSRRGCEDEEKTKNSNPAVCPQSSQTGQKQHNPSPHISFSASLGLASGLGMSSGPSGGHQVQNCDSSLLCGSKKRKEPVQDQPPDPEAPDERADDLDVSLEELESIMSEDMDEPMQVSTASKKQRLDQGESSAVNKAENPKQNSYNQRKVEKQQSISSRNQNLEQDIPSKASKHRDSERRPQTSNRAADLRLEEDRRDDYECGDVKEEEVSFAVVSVVF